MDPFWRSVFQSIGQSARRERRLGNHDKANGLVLIGLGIFLLPIPIIGIPLMIFGFRKLLK